LISQILPIRIEYTECHDVSRNHDFLVEWFPRDSCFIVAFTYVQFLSFYGVKCLEYYDLYYKTSLKNN